MLEINGLTVAYGERLALQNFSLSMQEGEIVVLVGESGSGKTTAIRSVLGLLPPGGAVTEGTISFEGQQLQGLAPREWKALRGKKLSMIFQDSGAMLNPIRTIGSQFREYIRTHSSLSKKEAGALSKEMLERMELSDPESQIVDIFCQTILETNDTFINLRNQHRKQTNDNSKQYCKAYQCSNTFCKSAAAIIIFNDLSK